MCVSMFLAEFTGTTLYAGEAIHPSRGLVRVLGYQNTAENRNDGVNAMLLHFPAAVPMTQDNILDTSSCRNILKDMVTAVKPRTRGVSFGGAIAKGVVVFEHDIYTIVLAQNAADIPNALHRVPERKRPNLNTPLFNYYGQRFRGWSVALCCFNNRDAQKAAPMLWWYNPMNPDLFLAPALDCHTGDVPNEKALVDVDTWMILGSHRMPRYSGEEVNYTDEIPSHIQPFLPSQVIGRYFYGNMPNGDFGAMSEHVIGGDSSRIVRLPPASLQ